jgi:hypothetical protein
LGVADKASAERRQVSALLKRLWFWYGQRTGLLSKLDGVALYGEPGSADFVYRGKLAEEGTVFFDCKVKRILLYNRVLNDAEIELLSRGWPPAFGTGDFTNTATINLDKP